MQKGIRWIDGKEYLLSGRCSDKEAAGNQARALRKAHLSVRVVKLWEYDFLIYVHG